MTRSQVSLRSAVPDDADRLADLWSEVLRRAEPADQAADVRSVIERVAPLHDERLVVAEYDRQLAGAVHLRAATMTPLNLEPVVQTISPHVFPEYRRHGVGRALMEASVAFAEELGIAHVATAVVAGSRDANRYMARLTLGPYALLRVAPAHTVKARLASRRPVLARRPHARPLTQVLAARRSQRKMQTPVT
jgi:GNAT superfamily N-acetyltransferase